jgi:molecular chaperone DnaJ
MAAAVDGAGAQGFEGFSDIFENIFGEFMGGGAGGGRSVSAQRGADLRYDLEISWTMRFTASTEQIRVDVAAACDVCDGSGAKPGTPRRGCGTCHGHGKVRAQQGFFVVERTCPTCHGRGQTISSPCVECHGEGRVEKSKTLELKIPPAWTKARASA